MFLFLWTHLHGTFLSIFFNCSVWLSNFGNHNPLYSCQTIESSEWNCQLQKQSQKAPSTIEVLGRKHCQELEIDGVSVF
jgi:hypothetical protein